MTRLTEALFAPLLQIYNYVRRSRHATNRPTSALTCSVQIPSLALAIVAIISFAVAFGLHLWWAVRTRYHTFHGLFTFGSAMEVVGWGCRAASHYRPFVVNYFIIQVSHGPSQSFWSMC